MILIIDVKKYWKALESMANMKNSLNSKNEVVEATILGISVSHCHWNIYFTLQCLKEKLFIKEFKIVHDLLSTYFSTILCPTPLHYSIS